VLEFFFTLCKNPIDGSFTEIRNFLGLQLGGTLFFRKAPVLGLYPTYCRAGTIITKGGGWFFFFSCPKKKEREREKRKRKRKNSVQSVGAFA
jgi:hypothetical protein